MSVVVNHASESVVSEYVVAESVVDEESPSPPTTKKRKCGRKKGSSLSGWCKSIQNEAKNNRKLFEFNESIDVFRNFCRNEMSGQKILMPLDLRETGKPNLKNMRSIPWRCIAITGARKETFLFETCARDMPSTKESLQILDFYEYIVAGIAVVEDEVLRCKVENILSDVIKKQVCAGF